MAAISVNAAVNVAVVVPRARSIEAHGTALQSPG